jgi:hypothetical protein
MHTTTDLAESFRSDCERFVLYGTHVQEMPAPSHENAQRVLSALHVEMKCWQAGPRPMNTRIYSAGNALHNAWTAMRVRGMSMAPDPGNLMVEAGDILKFILSTARFSSADPVRDWDEIFTMADFTLKRAAVSPAGNADPAALSTLGMRQKVWSIFIKYFVCWHFTQTAPPPGNLDLSVDWDRYAHAFHAPLDRRILNAIENLPVGTFLRKFIQNGNLRQTDGSLVPWSKLEDSATWWAYQRLMRRFASVAFPPEQAPSLGKVEPCEFASAVDSIPAEVLMESLRAMSPTDSPTDGVSSAVENSAGEPDDIELKDYLLEMRRDIEDLKLELRREIEQLKGRIAGHTGTPQLIPPPEYRPVSTETAPARPGAAKLDENKAIYLRYTGNGSYIKVLLGKYAGNNLALIGRNLRTLSLKQSCQNQFPNLWRAFHSLTPKPHSLNGSTPHGGVGYGGTANISKAEAINLFVDNGFYVIDETENTQGNPTQHHPA